MKLEAMVRRFGPLFFAAVAAAAGGCWGDSERCQEDPAARHEVTTPPAQRDARDQYQLAAELREVRATGGDALASALERMRQDWQGQRYRWTVAVVPVFCRSAERCMVAPFDHNRDVAEPIFQGWLPQLELEPAVFDRMTQDCAAHAQCVVSFTGKLKTFRLSLEDPTSLVFSEVALDELRGAREGESWIRRPKATLLTAASPAPKSDIATQVDPKVGVVRTPFEALEATEADLE